VTFAVSRSDLLSQFVAGVLQFQTLCGGGEGKTGGHVPMRIPKNDKKREAKT